MTRSYLHAAISPIGRAVCGHRGLGRGVSARRGKRPLPRFPVVDSVGGEGAQYLLPAELAEDAVSGALAPRFKLRDGRPRTTERTFYDTFDGRLHAANLVAVHAEGRLALAQADSLTELAAAERPDPPDRIFAAELESERLRELLERLVEVRALLPIARTTAACVAWRPRRPRQDGGPTDTRGARRAVRPVARRAASAR